MKSLSPLQEQLDGFELGRDYSEVCDIFSTAGLNLQGEILERLWTVPKGESIVVLDVGCGNGKTVRECIASSTLSAKNMGSSKVFNGIGVDQNLVDEDGAGNGFNLDLRKGDACDLPVGDNSVDVAYSVRTLVYVVDVLKAFEEVYRVLKPGGVAILDVYENEISLSHPFSEIVENTEGANEVFRYVKGDCSGAEWGFEPRKVGFVVCKKSSDDMFKGFSYRVEEEKILPVDRLRGHFKSAVYAQL